MLEVICRRESLEGGIQLDCDSCPPGGHDDALERVVKEADALCPWKMDAIGLQKIMHGWL